NASRTSTITRSGGSTMYSGKLTLVNSLGRLLLAIFSSGVRTVWQPQAAQNRRAVSQQAFRKFFSMQSMRHTLHHSPATALVPRPASRLIGVDTRYNRHNRSFAQIENNRLILQIRCSRKKPALAIIVALRVRRSNGSPIKVTSR